MLLNKKHPLFQQFVLRDVQGKVVPLVKAYDTKTKKAQVLLEAKTKEGKFSLVCKSNFGENKIATAVVSLPGSYLTWKNTGLKVKKDELK